MAQSQTNLSNPPNSRAFIKRTVEFKSLQAQRVMHRSFKKLKESIFSVSVILRIISEDEKQIESIDEFIDTQLINVEKEIASEQARLKKILEDNGIEETAHYSNPSQYTVELDSPRANTFLRLVSQLDNLMSLVETAWLCGEFDDKQRKEAAYKWQQRLIKLAARIMGLEKRARVAAYNKGKSEEVESQAPEDKTETDQEIIDAIEESADSIPALDEAV